MAVRDVSGACVEGPLAPYADAFAAQLGSCGYTPESVARHLRLMAQVNGWLAERDLGVAGLTPAAAREFFRWRRAAGYRQMLTGKALQPLLSCLRLSGAPVPAGGEGTPGPDDAVLARTGSTSLPCGACRRAGSATPST
jgi:integrase/recombinase XerD